MEGRPGRSVAIVSATDRVFLRRAEELAARGGGNTAPNPPVGAVIVRDGTTLGEGFHHRRGEPHAEVEAIRAAGGAALRGATLYVSLEPCDHHGLTPPCTQTLLTAGIGRVVIGALDPNPATAQRGVRRLRDAGVVVDVVDDPAARALVESFADAIQADRPHLTLKLAASLDGYVAPDPGSHWLTGAAAREFVRELRFDHDAVLVGAGTVRTDDPQLTLRPPRARRRPFVRVVACETAPVSPESRIFVRPEGAEGELYRATIVLAPAGLRARFVALERVAEILYAGSEQSQQLDLHAALVALKAAGVASVLCEGGPTLAAGLLSARLVDRVHWLLAPRLLANARAVAALARLDAAMPAQALQFERVERLGDDVLLSLRLESAACSVG
ncbi:MAG: bifunctional diaminohydroxyphosphoribosylaminopyrimidine deaminase/5-amino-6-(5-phosphoribosylamino)uracil reductase RibD [Vulcanimicrobiaceae bacterium]